MGMKPRRKSEPLYLPRDPHEVIDNLIDCAETMHELAASVRVWGDLESRAFSDGVGFAEAEVVEWLRFGRSAAARFAGDNDDAVALAGVIFGHLADAIEDGDVDRVGALDAVVDRIEAGKRHG